MRGRYSLVSNGSFDRVEEVDVKTLLRSGASDGEIAALVRRNVAVKWEGREIDTLTSSCFTLDNLTDRSGYVGCG